MTGFVYIPRLAFGKPFVTSWRSSKTQDSSDFRSLRADGQDGTGREGQGTRGRVEGVRQMKEKNGFPLSLRGVTREGRG